ncbi:hypothetical protein SteCoe_31847 [Stentor coeruleus]|uniref:UPF3 domain-containing protein n=1 Tax=Stentor coeruleus TaxID=5963 RepID=A0A1R2B0D1_9CILI|nr:hypothetical protein SteCoe_31847 [Stentor coeruleus]
MDSIYMKNNSKVVIRNLPGNMDENEFRILTQKFNSHIKSLRYLKSSQKGQKSKCFLQLSSQDLIAEFLDEFNKPFFDSKGEQFLPQAELSFFQEVAQVIPNSTDLYSTPSFLKFKELYESGSSFYDENQPPESPFEKKSYLILSIKQEAEEDKKREETKKPNKKKWKNKGKKWNKK